MCYSCDQRSGTLWIALLGFPLVASPGIARMHPSHESHAPLNFTEHACRSHSQPIAADAAGNSVQCNGAAGEQTLGELMNPCLSSRHTIQGRAVRRCTWVQDGVVDDTGEGTRWRGVVSTPMPSLLPPHGDVRRRGVVGCDDGRHGGRSEVASPT